MKTAVKMASQPCYEVYFDGAGMRPDGTGSGYSWINVTTGQKRVIRIDGLTNNQSEYRGLLSSVKNLPEYGEANLNSDSQLVVYQFNRNWVVRDPKLQRLLDRVREVIRERHLKVTLRWVPRKENLAGKLL
jgi:ribonuclease HI